MREKKIAVENTARDLLDDKLRPQRVAYTLKEPVPKLESFIGRAVSRIGPYKELDNREQVVALIDFVGTTIVHCSLYPNCSHAFRTCA